MKRQKEDLKVEYEQLRQAIADLSNLIEVEIPVEMTTEVEVSRFVKEEFEKTTNLNDLSGRVRVGDQSLSTIKNTLKTILEHLRRLYNKQGAQLEKSLQENIRSIMVLVGEAAGKMDKYTGLFKRIHGNAVADFKEYKDLQDFYSQSIMKPTNDRMAQWDFVLNQVTDGHLTSLSAVSLEIQEQEKQALSDVDTIKHDTDYELFLMEREDGSHFYSSDLLRLIQSACGSMDYASEFAGDDPFVQIKNWDDKNLQFRAAQITKSIRTPLEVYYKYAMKMRDMDLVILVNKALMALMLASNPKNLLRQFSVKSCSGYFEDFQSYFREVLQCLDYHKLLDRPPRANQPFLIALLDVIHGICKGLFTHLLYQNEVLQGIEKLIERGQPKTHPGVRKRGGESLIAEYLEFDYSAIESLIKQFPSGPLLKALDLFLEGRIPGFDPLILNNLSSQQYSLDIDGFFSTNLRLPSPTTQVMIHIASITEEFKGFLRSHQTGTIPKHHLLINLQDRTSWKEHARCDIIEQLQNQAEFHKALTVVTLAKETDFYYQLGPYQDLNQSKLFIDQFKEHLSSEQTGFYFPKDVSDLIQGAFLDSLLRGIHKVFFFNKNVLSRRQRLDFIELAYIFLQLKLIDMTHADTFSFTCKDAVDVGSTSSAQLFIFLKLINGHGFAQEDIEQLRMMLFAPSLLIRERLVNSERFQRTMHLIKLVENEIHRSSQPNLLHAIDVEFGRLLDTSVLQSKLVLPKFNKIDEGTWQVA